MADGRVINTKATQRSHRKKSGSRPAPTNTSPVVPQTYDSFLVLLPKTIVADGPASFGTVREFEAVFLEDDKPPESKDDDEEDELKFEEDYVPASLMDLLSSQELKRRLSKTEEPPSRQDLSTATSTTSSLRFQFFTPSSSATTVGFSPISEFKPLNFSAVSSAYNNSVWTSDNTGGFNVFSGGINSLPTTSGNTNNGAAFPKSARHSFGSNALSSSGNSLLNSMAQSPNAQHSVLVLQAQGSPSGGFASKLNYGFLNGASDETQLLINGVSSMSMKK